MTTLSFLSRITSSSNSFHPMTEASIRTWWTGLVFKPHWTCSWNSFRLYAMLPPVPPRVNEGRMMAGKSTRSMIASASSIDLAYPLSGTSRPILVMASLNRSRSSAFLMVSSVAPISCT